MPGKGKSAIITLARHFVFFLVSLSYCLLIPSFFLLAQQPEPIYLTLGRSPHDFDLFANTGWDGQWYVGYNSMWIVKLAPPSKDTLYARAYLGAKLGRVKSKPAGTDLRWDRESVPCDIYIGAAATPSWKSSDSFYLTSCEDLPLDGNDGEAYHGEGESRWHWVEIPLSKISFKSDNYLGIWSNTPGIISASSGPILAATIANGPIEAWLNHSIQGVPPIHVEDSLETKLNTYAPALAIKLIPVNKAEAVKVDLLSFKESPKAYLWEIQVIARNLDRVRPEISIDGKGWVAFGKSYFSPPFQVLVLRDRIVREIGNLIPGNNKIEQAYLRITAWDEWGNSGSTDNFVVYIKN